MSNPNKKLQEIAMALTHGNSDAAFDLTCPYCGLADLVYSYTVKRSPGTYGFYLICPNCHRGEHYHLAPKPPNFREELVLARFQQMEDEAGNQDQDDL